MNEKSDPKEVAYKFTVALNGLDFAEAKKYGTEDTKKMLEILSSIATLVPDSVKEESKNAKVEVTEVVENGDKCTVTLLNGDQKGEKINLVKENEIWKVHMSKDDMGAGEAEKVDEEK